jgi:hypothetical protein
MKGEAYKLSDLKRNFGEGIYRRSPRMESVRKEDNTKWTAEKLGVERRLTINDGR